MHRSAARVLREGLARTSPVIAGEAFSALGARVVEQAGFDAVYVGGGALAAVQLAEPDLGRVAPAEFLPFVSLISSATSLPVICDIDHGAESASGTGRLVRQFERAGASAVHIEDAIAAKKLRGVSIESLPAYRARIAAAVAAKSDEDFVVIARSDIQWTGRGDIRDLVERARAAEEEGADVFFPPLTSAADLVRLREEIDLPLMEINERADDSRGVLDLAVYCGMPARVTARALGEWARSVIGSGAQEVIDESLRAPLRAALHEQALIEELEREAGRFPEEKPKYR